MSHLEMGQGYEPNPALFKLSSLQYMDRIIRQEGLNEMGEIIFPFWSELPADVKEEQIKILRDKWRYIQENYLNNPGTKQDGPIPAKRRKHVLVENCNGQMSETSSPFLEMHPREVVVETSPHTASNSEAKVRPPLVGRKIQRVNPCQKNLCSAMNCQQTKMEELDADRSFLLSLLMDYNRLTYEQKIDFRICTLQFLKNVIHPKTGKANKTPGNGPRYTCSPSSASNLLNHETKQDSQGIQEAVPSQQRAVDCSFPPAVVSVQMPKAGD